MRLSTIYLFYFFSVLLFWRFTQRHTLLRPNIKISRFETVVGIGLVKRRLAQNRLRILPSQSQARIRSIYICLNFNRGFEFRRTSQKQNETLLNWLSRRYSAHDRCTSRLPYTTIQPKKKCFKATHEQIYRNLCTRSSVKWASVLLLLLCVRVFVFVYRK